MRKLRPREQCFPKAKCEQVGGRFRSLAPSSVAQEPSCTFPMPQAVFRVLSPGGRHLCSLTLGRRPAICQKLWEDWLELPREAGGLS